MPVRGLLLQNAQALAVSGLSAELSQRFHHWVVRFFAAKPFDALASRHSCLAIRAELAAECIDKRGLANTDFSGDKENLPLSSEDVSHCALKLIHLRGAANQLRRRRCPSLLLEAGD